MKWSKHLPTPDPFNELQDALCDALLDHENLVANFAKTEGDLGAAHMLAGILVRTMRKDVPQRLWLDLGGQAPLLPAPEREAVRS